MPPLRFFLVRLLTVLGEALVDGFVWPRDFHVEGETCDMDTLAFLCSSLKSRPFAKSCSSRRLYGASSPTSPTHRGKQGNVARETGDG